MRMEDLYIRLLIAIICIGCLFSLLPWWVILIIVSPILFVGFKIWWKIRQIKKMSNEGGNPFGQQGPFGQQNPFEQQNPFGQQQTTTRTTQSNPDKKVFHDDEGEYVEFEDVE